MFHQQVLQPAAPKETRELITTVSQYIELANNLRQKGQISRAIRMVERAVVLCQGQEQSHPALAIEAARARVNLSAALSEGLRHREALVAIKEAQAGLNQVLTWVSECKSEDPGVKHIAQEARALRCAALVAEAIELELCPPIPEEHAQKSLESKEVARNISEHLGRSHPLAALAKSLSGGSSSSADKHSQGATYQKGQLGEALPAIGSPVPKTSGRPKAAVTEDTGPHGGRRDGKRGPNGTEKSQSSMKIIRHRPGRSDESSDVFSEFLKSVDAEKQARLLALSNNWEDQAKRKLGQVHRTTKLQLELNHDDDLKDKRYTKTGHEVFMKALKESNRCWSDPALVTEAQKERVEPSICQVRKLNRQILAKPSTPILPGSFMRSKIGST